MPDLRLARPEVSHQRQNEHNDGSIHSWSLKLRPVGRKKVEGLSDDRCHNNCQKNQEADVGQTAVEGKEQNKDLAQIPSPVSNQRGQQKSNDQEQH